MSRRTKKKFLTTDKQELKDVIQGHYDELAKRYNVTSGNIGEDLYKESSSLFCSGTNNLHQGKARIKNFWQDKFSADSWRNLSFAVDPSSIRIFPVNMKDKYSDQAGQAHDIVELASVTVKLSHNPAGPVDFETVWCHWDDCQWWPESEDFPL